MHKKKFTPPALHNLARSAWDTADEVRDALVDAYLGHPQFSYKLLGEIIRTAIRGKFSKAALDAAVIAHQKNPTYRSIFLEITPLIHEHFGDMNPKFVVEVQPQKYLINDIEIPFKPPFLFKVGDDLILPWFIFWKKNPLTAKQRSLLATMISELLSQHPDYEGVKVLIYDFSVDPDTGIRTLKITDLADIPKLDPDARDAALLVFLEGYALAVKVIEALPAKKRQKRDEKDPDPNQPGLFD